MIYNKLIRDKVLETLDSKGIVHHEHIADNEEYEQKLFEKLDEEVKEFQEAKSVEELADVLEVIDSIKKLKNLNNTEVERVKLEKFNERGGFDKRIILEES